VLATQNLGGITGRGTSCPRNAARSYPGGVSVRARKFSQNGTGPCRRRP
jgi:hypothetical protein